MTATMKQPVRRLSDGSSGLQTALTWTLSDDDASVGSHAQQMAELRALLTEKDQRIAELEERVKLQQAQLEQQLQLQQQHQEVSAEEDENEDEDDENSQVRDQIAAVKASLQQGCHQAKANQDSLNEELETCRRLQQKLANRKDCHHSARTTSSPPKQQPKPSLTEQLSALVASVQEREQSLAEIAQSFNNQAATIPVSLYQAEIQQWKQALAQLEPAQDTDTTQVVSSQSNQLLQQAHDKLQRLESALTVAQAESLDQQARAQTLWQVVQKLEQDKEEEIHLLDIVMEHLLELEQEEQQQHESPPKSPPPKKKQPNRHSVVVDC